MTESFNWREHLNHCMAQTQYCCLATNGTNGVWSSPVYFAWDGFFNIYFISQLHSRHMKDILMNPQISISIYSTQQDTFGDVIGIQLCGSASILTLPEEIEIARKIYAGRRYAGKEKRSIDEDQYITDPGWHFVKVAPLEMFYFDTRFFGEMRAAVPKEILVKQGWFSF